jgi:hypothetical protein
VDHANEAGISLSAPELQMFQDLANLLATHDYAVPENEWMDFLVSQGLTGE